MKIRCNASNCGKDFELTDIQPDAGEDFHGQVRCPHCRSIAKVEFSARKLMHYKLAYDASQRPLAYYKRI